MRKRTLLLTASGLLVAAFLWHRTRRSGSKAPSERGILGPEAVRRLYDRLAPVYDFAAAAYDFAGAGCFHRRAARALDLRPGDTAVDLGCGTGANLPYLVEAVGLTGRVVGSDLSPGVLGKARDLAGGLSGRADGGARFGRFDCARGDRLRAQIHSNPVRRVDNRPARAKNAERRPL